MRRLSGFSLMEMMIVLLIVAIVAAASAPMVSRKMLDTSAGSSSPWQWADLGSNAVFNMSGKNNASAIIGAGKPARGENPKLFINNAKDDTTPHITFGEEGNSKLNLLVINNSAHMTNTNVSASSNSVTLGIDSQTGSDAVAIGYGAQTFAAHGVSIGKESKSNGTGAVSIGDNSSNGAKGANNDYAIALGYDANATGKSSIAIGGYGATGTSGSSTTLANTESTKEGAIAIGAATSATGKNAICLGAAKATAENSIAIGKKAEATHQNSLALGYNSKTTDKNQIVLGDQNTTVVIPGTIAFQGDVTVAGNLAVKNSLAMGSGVVVNGRFFGGTLFDDGNQNGIGRRVKSDGGSRTDNKADHTGYKLYQKAFSDRRLKNVGETFTDGLDKIRKIKVFNYTYKNDTDKTPQVGVMAQDLQKIFPKAVTKGEDGFLRIRLEDMFYAAINAIQQNDKRITELEKQNKELLKRIEKLERGK